MQNALVFVCGAVVAAGVAIGTGIQDEKKPGKMQDENAAMQMPKPTPEHEWLAKMTGTWKAKMTITMPDGVKTSTGVETLKMGCNGLWQMCDFVEDKTGAMGGFQGHGICSYDPDHKTFGGSWCDSMSYSPTRSEGTLSADRKVLTMNATGYCPIRKQVVNHKQVSTFTDDRHRTFQMIQMGPEGKETETLKIEYTRE